MIALGFAAVAGAGADAGSAFRNQSSLVQLGRQPESRCATIDRNAQSEWNDRNVMTGPSETRDALIAQSTVRHRAISR
jgi:hypothetical protein